MLYNFLNAYDCELDNFKEKKDSDTYQKSSLLLFLHNVLIIELFMFYVHI